MTSEDIGIKITYDDHGRVTCINTPFINRKHTFTYDDKGRLTIDSLNDSIFTYYTYDENDRVIRIKYVNNYNEIKVEEFTYNESNHLVATHVLDDSGIEYWSGYDIFGHKIYFKSIGDDGYCRIVKTEYDNDDNIVYTDTTSGNLRHEKWFNYDKDGKSYITKETKHYL